MRGIDKLILWGAGNKCRILLELINKSSFAPQIHIIDSSMEKWGTNMYGYEVEAPDILREIQDSFFCITTANYIALEEIRENIIEKYEISEDKEITYQGLIEEVYDHISFERNNNLSKKNRHTLIFDCEYGLGLGGIEEWTKGICTQFNLKNEYMSYVLCNYDDFTIPDNLRRNILRVDVRREEAFTYDNVQKIINCISEHLPCIIVTSQPDDVLLSGRILKRMYGDLVKVVSGIRGGHREIYKRYYEMRDCTDIYVCVSSMIREKMIKSGIDSDKVFTMLCPIECPDTNRFYSLDRKEPIHIGYAGRIQHDEKRFDLMLKMCEVLEKNHINYSFEIAGEGNYEKEVYNFIDANHCRDRLKIVGKLDKQEIKKFWQKQDVCVNISDIEGRSRTTIEAMANGVVPVVTETEGVHDDIFDNENGFIVNLQDYEAMAERIAFLEANRNLLPIMGEKAYLELKKKSSMEDHYKFWKMIISKLVS